jgi:uncharacterized protein YlxW (UPF0749 family)
MSTDAPAPVPPHHAGGPAHRAGRDRLEKALRPRFTRAQIIAAVLCGMLGFAAAVQVRANQDSDLAGLRQTDLVRILDDVTERSARLQAEARDLEAARAEVTDVTSGSRAALEEARARVRTLGILAGTVPATGPGIEFTISDPKGEVQADLLLDALQELRDAGAEAVEISTPDGPRVRVVASTHLVDVDGGGAVEVDEKVVEAPYQFRVIGEPRTLAAALDIPGGVLDVLRQRDASGLVTQRSEITISSLQPAPAPEYARPAPEDGDDDKGGG